MLGPAENLDNKLRFRRGIFFIPAILAGSYWTTVSIRFEQHLSTVIWTGRFRFVRKSQMNSSGLTDGGSGVAYGRIGRTESVRGGSGSREAGSQSRVGGFSCRSRQSQTGIRIVSMADDVQELRYNRNCEINGEKNKKQTK